MKLRLASLSMKSRVGTSTLTVFLAMSAAIGLAPAMAQTASFQGLGQMPHVVRYGNVWRASETLTSPNAT